jgi:hypothetical protein
MNLRVPQNARNFLSVCTIGSFSRRAQLHEWVSEWVSEPSLEDSPRLIASGFHVFGFRNNKFFREQVCRSFVEPPIWRTKTLYFVP